jgi:hypothetical protein
MVDNIYSKGEQTISILEKLIADLKAENAELKLNIKSSQAMKGVEFKNE